MSQIMTTNKEMPQFYYMPLPNGYADVFVYKFISVDKDTENGDVYNYMSNEFRTNKVSYEDVSADPLKYLEYSEKEETVEEKLIRLEEEISKLTYTLNQISQYAIEVDKKDNSDMPTGDYLNPIHYVEGMSVIQGLFYYTDDKDLCAEALRTGTPNGWNTEWFNIIQI